jgi:hypothetical protein
MQDKRQVYYDKNGNVVQQELAAKYHKEGKLNYLSSLKYNLVKSKNNHEDNSGLGRILNTQEEDNVDDDFLKCLDERTWDDF